MSKLQLGDFVYSYPAQDDPLIQTKLSAKREFFEMASKMVEPVPYPGEGYPHQNLFTRYALEYNHSLIFHRTGTGKSCTVFGSAEQFTNSMLEGSVDFLMNYIKPRRSNIKRIYILTKGPALVEELRRQLVCICTNGKYITDLVVNSKAEPQRKKNITAAISPYYSIITYSKLVNEIIKRKMDADMMREAFSDCIFYVDEVQNLRLDPSLGPIEEQRKNYSTLHTLFHVIQRGKVILASATPMVDDVNEISQVMNLILPMNMQLDYSRQTDYKNVTLQQMEPYFRGRISYVRELDTGAIPTYIESDITFTLPDHIMEDGRTIKSQTKLYVTEMGPSQESVANFVADEKTQFRAAERKVSNFIFPNGSYTKEAFDHYVERTAADQYRPRNGLEQFLSNMDSLRQLSCKYPEIIRITRDEPGNTFCYCDFKEAGGAITLGISFQALGFEQYLETGSAFRRVRSGVNAMSAVLDEYGRIVPGAAAAAEGNTLRPYCGTSGKGSSQREVRLRKYNVDGQPYRFALLTSDTPATRVASILELFNSKENMNGEYIKVIIGSPVSKIGLNLANVLQVHMVGPSWNQSNMYQAISRAIRSTSHVMILESMRSNISTENVPLVDIGSPLNLVSTGPLSGNIGTSTLSGNIGTSTLSGNIGTSTLSGNIGTPIISSTRSTPIISSERGTPIISSGGGTGIILPDITTLNLSGTPTPSNALPYSSDTSEGNIQVLRSGEFNPITPSINDTRFASTSNLPAYMTPFATTIIENVTVNVNIYQHTAIYKKANGEYASIDSDMYRSAEKKDIEIRRMERFMKQCAIDCQIHTDRNMRATDTDGSAICDYDECFYPCVSPRPTEVDESSFAMLYSGPLIVSTKREIIRLMTSSIELTYEEIQASLEIVSMRYILQACYELIRDKTSVKDRFGRTAYLIDTGRGLSIQSIFPLTTSSVRREYLNIINRSIVPSIARTVKSRQSTLGILSNTSVVSGASTTDLSTLGLEGRSRDFSGKSILRNTGNKYYLNVLHGILKTGLRDFVGTLQVPKELRLVDTLKTSRISESQFKQILNSLSLNTQIVVLEEAIVNLMSGSYTDFYKKIYDEYKSYIFTIKNPIDEINAAIMKMPATAYKDRSRNVERIKASTMNQPSIYKEGPEIIVHNLSNKAFDRVSHGVTSKFSKAEGKLRVLDSTRSGTSTTPTGTGSAEDTSRTGSSRGKLVYAKEFRDASIVEQPILNKKLQKLRIQVANKLGKQGVYGSILASDGKFRIHDLTTQSPEASSNSKFINTGKICENWYPADLVDVLYILGVPAPNVITPGFTSTSDIGGMINYLYQNRIETPRVKIAQMDEAKVRYFYNWLTASRYNTRTLCQDIQTVLESRQLILR